MINDLFDLTGVPTIVGTGLIALDVVINADRKARPRLYAGGTCGNVLTILSYLGWEAYPVARMNNDPASRFVLRDLKRWGVRTAFARLQPFGDTPMVIERIRRLGSGHVSHRFSWTCPKCGAWLPGYKAVLATAISGIIPQLRAPKVFFFDRLSRGAVELAKACADLGAVIVFEPSGMGDPALFAEVLGHVHILKYSNERMNEMSGKQSASGPLLIIETLGAEGLRYRSNLPSFKSAGWQSISACKISEVEDSAGAGDWCTAGILHLLASQGLQTLQMATHEDVCRALNFGQAMAAWNCQYEGARGGMYEVDRKRLRNEINHILFGQALDTAVRKGVGEAVGITLKCMAPACSTKRRGDKRSIKHTARITD